MQAVPPPIPQTSSPETVRNELLKHEASIQSVGVLYLIGSVLMIVSGIIRFMEAPGNPVGMVVAGLLLTLGLLQGWTGRLLRKLDPKAVMPATLLSVIGLLGIPIGTLISAYVLYLLHSAKGKKVFSAEYREVIAATPHIKYKMSRVVWFLLALLIVLLVMGIVASFFAKK